MNITILSLPKGSVGTGELKKEIRDQSIMKVFDVSEHYCRIVKLLPHESCLVQDWIRCNKHCTGIAIERLSSRSKYLKDGMVAIISNKLKLSKIN